VAAAVGVEDAGEHAGGVEAPRAAPVDGPVAGDQRGGHFSITPVDGGCPARRYLGESLVLETTIETATGRGRLVDALAMRHGGGRSPRHQLLRVLYCDVGEVSVDVVLEPRFDYGALVPWVEGDHPNGAVTAVGGDTALVISGAQGLDTDEEEGRVTGRVTLRAGQHHGLSVQWQAPHRMAVQVCTDDEIVARLDETIAWWHRWSASTVADGPYADLVRRSAVVLKGLTCAPTGAIVAAPTTSLPEHVGGERNWDYRFCWVRDATLTLAAMSLVGHDEVARGFRDFLMRSAAGRAEDLQVLYGVYGSRFTPEVTLPELEGWRGSRPVRIGNHAADQVQHDAYGHVLDAALLWRDTHRGTEHARDRSLDEQPAEAEWRFLRLLVERACEVWTEPDSGIWEVRSAPEHFTASKAMLWVALDRGIRLAEELGLDEDRLPRWRETRAAIRERIDSRCVSPAGHFRQHEGTDEVDAALLQLALVGFVQADDPRMVATVERIRTDLTEQGFVRRYRTDRTADGLEGEEGVFLLCSFWMVDVLAMQGRAEEARALFERLVTAGNDLGLFAEEYDPTSGELLGNFPQAFTHLALIEAAHSLQESAPLRPGVNEASPR
jgi:GH15 family glucan-1,4-alpha-glucosidase